MEKVKLQVQYGLYINGQWRDASDGATYNAESPADGSHLAVCAQGSREDVEAASAAAWEAFKTWKKTTPAQRAALLNKIADIIDANKEHLAMVESMDNGKPIRETMNVDIPMAAEHFRYFAGCILAEEGQASVLNEQFLSIILRLRLINDIMEKSGAMWVKRGATKCFWVNTNTLWMQKVVLLCLLSCVKVWAVSLLLPKVWMVVFLFTIWSNGISWNRSWQPCR